MVEKSLDRVSSKDPKSYKIFGSSESDTFLEKILNKFTPEQPLTRCEKEVLKLIMAGKTNKETALILSRTERTVEFHRNKLMKKFDAHTPAELVLKAIAMGISI